MPRSRHGLSITGILPLLLLFRESSIIMLYGRTRIIDEAYRMIMTADLEGRIQTMCNLSENIEAKGIEKELTDISQNFNVSVDFSTPSIV